MPIYRIGEYFEVYQQHETPHKEQFVECNSIIEARDEAKMIFGWGSWAREEKINISDDCKLNVKDIQIPCSSSRCGCCGGGVEEGYEYCTPCQELCGVSAKHTKA